MRTRNEMNYITTMGNCLQTFNEKKKRNGIAIQIVQDLNQVIN